MLQLRFYSCAIDAGKILPHGGIWFRSSPLLQTPTIHALLSRLDALYAERDDAVGEGDLDRVHELQAAITETAQQVLAAKMVGYRAGR